MDAGTEPWTWEDQEDKPVEYRIGRIEYWLRVHGPFVDPTAIKLEPWQMIIEELRWMNLRLTIIMVTAGLIAVIDLIFTLRH
jgi:hypothetical protein